MRRLVGVALQRCGVVTLVAERPRHPSRLSDQLVERLRAVAAAAVGVPAFHRPT